MEHPFFPTTTTRAEALHWLTISEKLLSTRDLQGSKSFATRARDSDPTLSIADQIIAVADTLIAGDRRIGTNQLPDWYAILRLTPQQTCNFEHISTQYHNLTLLLNPQRNQFPFAEQAFRLVTEACSVLSNPVRKSMYDKDIVFYLQQQHQPDPFSNSLPTMQQNFMFFGGSAAANSFPHPHLHLGGFGRSDFVNLQQVNAGQSQLNSGSTREPQHFVNFNSGSSSVFGPGFTHSREPVNKQVQENLQPNQPEEENHKSGTPNMNMSENVNEVVEDEEIGVEEETADEPENYEKRGSTFWTTCPYCYNMYEYPSMYANCCLRCQNCKKAFEGVAISSPPSVKDGEEVYFCCWGFLPLGFSENDWEKNKGVPPAQTPLGNVNKKMSGLKSSTPRVYIDDDDDDDVEISESDDSDDDDWVKGTQTRKKKAKFVKVKRASNGIKYVNASRKQPHRVAKNFGKLDDLDLNVELSSVGNGQGSGEEDTTIGGNDFFEGFDEYLNTIPILNDDKGVEAS